jgi:hypothetical protein
MASSGMLRLVILVRTDVSEELSASFIRVTRIGELGTTLAPRSVRRLLVTASVVPSSPILVTLMKEALSFSETSVFTRATWHNIPEDAILQTGLCVIYYEVKLNMKNCVFWDVTPCGSCKKRREAKIYLDDQGQGQGQC